MEKQEVLSIVKTECDELATLMKMSLPEYEIDESVSDELVIFVKFPGENMGYIIGPHGRHLQSLQYVVSLLIRRLLPEENMSIIVDAGDYIGKKIKRIEQIALRKADDARILGGAIDLEPMNAFERKIVHTTLSKFDDVKTESFGEGNDRYVRIDVVSDKELGIGNEDGEISEEEEISE